MNPFESLESFQEYAQRQGPEMPSLAHEEMQRLGQLAWQHKLPIGAALAATIAAGGAYRYLKHRHPELPVEVPGAEAPPAEMGIEPWLGEPKAASARGWRPLEPGEVEEFLKEAASPLAAGAYGALAGAARGAIAGGALGALTGGVVGTLKGESPHDIGQRALRYGGYGALSLGGVSAALRGHGDYRGALEKFQKAEAATAAGERVSGLHPWQKTTPPVERVPHHVEMEARSTPGELPFPLSLAAEYPAMHTTLLRDLHETEPEVAAQYLEQLRTLGEDPRMKALMDHWDASGPFSRQVP